MAAFDVLLPVKNGLAYLGEAIDSIRQQTYQDWRLLVLDHGSSDGSLELAQQYAERDRRIVVHALPQAQGLSGLLNAGLALCDARYVLRQDADDVSLPPRMDVLAQALEADPQLVLVGSLGDVVDAGGRRIGLLDMPTGEHGMRISTPFRTPAAHPTVALRLAALQRMNARYGVDFIGALPAGRRMEVPGLAEDYFLFGQLALVSRCVNIGRSLIKYRWHGANVGATKYVDQTQVALDISRYLVASLAAMHGVEAVDPAPFCNHGVNLFNVNGRTDFTQEYQQLSRLMTRAMPDCAALRRELSYRWAIAHRANAVMAARYLGHALRHGVRHVEWRTVRSWLIRDLKPQPILTLTPSGVSA